MKIIFQGIEGAEIKILMCVFVNVYVNFEMLVSHLGAPLSKSISLSLFLYL